MIPYGRQSISETDIQAVVDVLKSDYLTQGPVVPAFENAVARYCGASHAVTTNSATSALHLACLALNVGPSDYVWTSPISFVASANCALYCGAKVDFVDVDPITLNMSMEGLARKLAQAKSIDQLPKVVIPVHFAGQPCEMDMLQELRERYGFKVVEDASHAIGARYRGEPVGNGRYSDITVFSFHPVKIITTGEGGMALTNDAAIARRLELLRSHGITRDPAEMNEEPEGPWYYQQISLGFNYRMTELQAALGLSQLDRLNEFVSRRRVLAERYRSLLNELPLRLPVVAEEIESAWHLYTVVLDLGNTSNLTRRTVFDSLRTQGVAANVHYIPVYLQPYFRAMGFEPGYCPNAEDYYRKALTLPLFPALTESKQNAVAASVRVALNG